MEGQSASIGGGGGFPSLEDCESTVFIILPVDAADRLSLLVAATLKKYYPHAGIQGQTAPVGKGGRGESDVGNGI